MPENPKTYTLKFKTRHISANGVIEDELVPYDPTLYAREGSFGAGISGQSAVLPVDASSTLPGVIGSIVPVFMDIASLRDADAENPGFYVGMGSYGSNFKGAALYELIGSDYSEIASFGARATIGVATTVLASGTTTIFDDVNTVDIELIDDESTLESVADVDIFAGRNAALVGSEILSFGTATLTAPKKYTLSHLLRGVKGTEWAIGTHMTGERFVLLDDSIQRITDTLADLNRARVFHIAAIGSTFEAGFDTNFIDTGVSLKPYSPVLIHAEQNAAGEVIIEWTRRSRQGGLSGLDFFDPPLAETTEAYQIDILNTGETAVLRTLSSTVEYVKYSVANQTADYGASPPSALHVNVYQISSVVGRGYPGHAVITTFPAGEKPDIGTFQQATAPTSPVAGQTIWIDTTANTINRWNGTAWESVAWGSSGGPGSGGSSPPGNVGPLFAFTEWDDGIYSWVNQGTATISTADGGVYITTPALAGDNVRLRVRTAPATPYKLTIFCIGPGDVRASSSFGIMFRESSSGKLHALNYSVGGSSFSSAKWTNPILFSASYLTSPASNFIGIGGNGFWFRIEDDGTNRNCYLSPDGKHWQQFHTIGRTDFLTANQIGYYVNSVNTLRPCSMWVMSLKVD